MRDVRLCREIGELSQVQIRQSLGQEHGKGLGRGVIVESSAHPLAILTRTMSTSSVS